MLNELHSCPRKYQLIKSRAASGGKQGSTVDFSFGHSVGAGIQSWLITGDIDTALFNAFLAWRVSYDAVLEKSSKSIWTASLAVMKFPEFYAQCLDDWELFVLPSGKPAVEVSVEVDFENGYKHYLHIDAILVNKRTGQLAVLENKTLGMKSVEAALYANSSQALSYAVLLDQLQVDSSYEVFYCVYSTPNREWQLLPFTKSSSQRAEWITDVRMDHAALSMYKDMGFFPKRGGSCFSFSRRCEFFGECNLTSNLPELRTLPDDESAEEVDFSCKRSELVTTQLKKLET